MNFSVEEENLICMYHTSDRRRTMARMLAALPDVDTEMRRLANSTIAKLERMTDADFDGQRFATVYKGNIIKNLIMDCQSYTKYRPNETTGGIFVSWRRKEELPTGA